MWLATYNLDIALNVALHYTLNLNDPIKFQVICSAELALFLMSGVFFFKGTVRKIK